MCKALLVLFAILSLTLGFAGTASAQSVVPANEAVEICRSLEEGTLEGIGATFGECVNQIRGPASGNANNFLADLCGEEFVQEFFGTTNKGQCIKAVRGL
jgi:hypothetical protein